MSLVSMVESQLKKLGLDLNKVLVIVAVVGMVYIATQTDVPGMVMDQVSEVSESVVKTVTGEDSDDEEVEEEVEVPRSSCSGKTMVPEVKKAQNSGPGAFDGNFDGLSPL